MGSKEQDPAMVLFIDYGNVTVVPAKQLRTLPAELWARGPQAVPFRISGEWMHAKVIWQ